LLYFKIDRIIRILVLFSSIAIIIVFIIPVCHMLHHRFARVKASGLPTTATISLLASFRRWHKLSSASQPRLATLIIEKLIGSRIILIIGIIEGLLIILVVIVVVVIVVAIVLVVLLIVLILAVAIVRLVIAILATQTLLFILLVYLELLSSRYEALWRRLIIIVLVS
jgi:hypothetical protein